MNAPEPTPKRLPQRVVRRMRLAQDAALAAMAAPNDEAALVAARVVLMAGQAGDIVDVCARLAVSAGRQQDVIVGLIGIVGAGGEL